MYLEILSKVVEDYLKDAKPNPSLIIHLTPNIYKALQDELNSVIHFDTQVPIQTVKVESIVIHERTVKIDSNDKLDDKFEKRLIEALANKGIIK
jgi:hypothetical protein